MIGEKKTRQSHWDEFTYVSDRAKSCASGATFDPADDSAGPPIDRDLLCALEQQAERSIQVAGAAFQEAKELAAAYKDELQCTRQAHREELRRVRWQGRFGWSLVAAAVLVILGGVWFLAQQNGEQDLQRANVAYLTERLGQTREQHRRRQDRLEALRTEGKQAEEELRSARLAQADTVGQLAAYRAHTERLHQRLRRLEAEQTAAEQAHQAALERVKAQAEQARRDQEQRLRRQLAEKAEEQRAAMLAQARAERKRLRQENETLLQAGRNRVAQGRKTPPARTRQRSGYRRIDNNRANLTLTELEKALVRKSQ